MKSLHKIISSSGGRITKIKKAIIEVLSSQNCFYSKNDIVFRLKKKNIYPNRSTIYRVLNFLTKNRIVLHNNINGTDYYEIPKKHHHHLICLSCKQIEQLHICNLLKKHEKYISTYKKFLVVNHSLEFYGLCHKCQ